MTTVDPDDISKRIFMDAVNSALSKCDGSIWALSSKLGLKSNCYNWTKGHMPPYAKMQSFYVKLMEIAKE